MNKLVLAILLAASSMGLQAQQQQEKRTAKTTVPSSYFTASAFGGYYYNVEHPSASLKDKNAFELNRVDIGFGHIFSRNVNVFSEIEAAGADDEAGAPHTLFMKQAYVEVKNILPQMRVVMGLSPTPAVVTSERIWGYRALRKTPLELYGMAPSVDNGIVVKGKIDPDGIVAYHMMVGNGTGVIKETDNIKRFYASLGLTPASGFTLEGYADFENAGNERYRATFKGLLGLEGTEYSLGLEGIYRINHHTLTQWYNESPYAVSLYGWTQAGECIRLVYRGDYSDDDQNKKKSGLRTIEAMFGIDYMPAPEVHIIPTIHYTTYTNKNSSAPAIDDALTVRLTAAFSFSTLH